VHRTTFFIKKIIIKKKRKKLKYGMYQMEKKQLLISNHKRPDETLRITNEKLLYNSKEIIAFVATN